MTTLITLQRQRCELVAEAREALEEMRDCTDPKREKELSKRHEQTMRELDLLDLDIQEARMMGEEWYSNSHMRPDQSGIASGVAGFEHYIDPAFRGDGLWTDAKGNPITVLENNQRMATHNNLGVGFGDYVRALVNGPRSEAEKRALSEGTQSEGGYTVPAPVSSEFIDKLRANTAAIKAGARTVPMTSSSLSMARLDTDPTVSWRLENALIEDSDPVFSQLLLEAKACAGLVRVSRELLTDSVNVNEILTTAFVQVMARELDRVALWNDGADDGPVGVAATSGINSVEMAANGAALSNHDKLLDAIYEMKVDNAASPTAAIMHPRTETALEKLKTGDGVPLPYPPMLANLPRYATTSASIAETQGSANNASSILFGNFRELFIGIRDQVSITILKERYADYGQVGFLVWMRADVQLAHKASFCRLKGIIPAS